nr:MAG TPA: hypothetical protein [Caudoviricetes sp.]
MHIPSKKHTKETKPPTYFALNRPAKTFLGKR